MIEFFSNAKINIGLHILSKRDDGYHNIETIFYPIKLSDKLIFEYSKSFEILSNNPSFPKDESNLISKARNLLQKKVGKELNFTVTVEKNIPMFAGLGGGSSNTAITLCALNKIFELNLTNDELFSLASQLGSDVPFFLYNIPCFAEGKGEILTPLKDFILDYKILIVYPKIKISTAWAYSQFQYSSKQINLKEIKSKFDFEKNKSKIINDFETIIFSKFKELEKIKDILINAGAIYASLSGSGSAIYGFFPNNNNLDMVKNLLNQYELYEC